MLLMRLDSWMDIKLMIIEFVLNILTQKKEVGEVGRDHRLLIEDREILTLNLVLQKIQNIESLWKIYLLILAGKI